MRAFTLNEMENIFEIGRAIQLYIDKRAIAYYESKEAFLDALTWAMEFEEKYKETEDYYWDLSLFITKKLKEKGLL